MPVTLVRDLFSVVNFQSLTRFGPVDIDRFIVVKPDQYYTATTTPGATNSGTATPTIRGNGGTQGAPVPTGSGPSNPSGTPGPGDDAGHRAVLSMLYLPVVLWAMFFH